MSDAPIQKKNEGTSLLDDVQLNNYTTGSPAPQIKPAPIIGGSLYNSATSFFGNCYGYAKSIYNLPLRQYLDSLATTPYAIADCMRTKIYGASFDLNLSNVTLSWMQTPAILFNMMDGLLNLLTQKNSRNEKFFGGIESGTASASVLLSLFGFPEIGVPLSLVSYIAKFIANKQKIKLLCSSEDQSEPEKGKFLNMYIIFQAIFATVSLIGEIPIANIAKLTADLFGLGLGPATAITDLFIKKFGAEYTSSQKQPSIV